MTVTAVVTRLQSSGHHAALPAGRTPGSTWLDRNGFAAAAIAMLMASDYKFRVRGVENTLSGGVDLFILLEVAVYGLVGGVLLLRMTGRPRVRRMPAVVFLAGAYVAAIVVSVGYSPYKPLGAVRAMETCVLFGLTAHASAHATREHLHRFAHAFILLVSGSVIFGVLFPMPKFPLQENRFTWLRLHPIPAGVYVGIATLLCLAYLLTRTRVRPGPSWGAPAYLVAGGICGWGLVATQTRNAVLGAGVGAVLLVLLLNRRRRRFQLFAVLAPAAALIALAASTVTSEYFARGESTQQLASFNSRTTLWGLAFDAFKVQPVFGYGTGASRGLFLDQTGLGGAHNALINVAVDLGVVGVVVWLGLLVVLVLTLSHLPWDVDDGIEVDRAVIVSVLALLTVGGVFYEGLGATSNVASTWLFVLVAWTAVLARARRDSRSGTLRRSPGSSELAAPRP